MSFCRHLEEKKKHSNYTIKTRLHTISNHWLAFCSWHFYFWFLSIKCDLTRAYQPLENPKRANELSKECSSRLTHNSFFSFYGICCELLLLFLVCFFFFLVILLVLIFLLRCEKFQVRDKEIELIRNDV